MSGFINYNKRSVTLPEGCKDLIDLLRPHPLPVLFSNADAGPIPPGAQPTLTRGETFEGRVSDIDKFLERLFESRALSCLLLLTPPGEQFTIHIHRHEPGSINASVIYTGTRQAQGVRLSFTRLGLNPPPEPPPLSKFHSAPSQRIAQISPIPAEAPLLAQLVTELFEDVFGCTHDSHLSFRYYETTSAEEAPGTPA
jgi:hypothetical protein